FVCSHLKPRCNSASTFSHHPPCKTRPAGLRAELQFFIFLFCSSWMGITSFRSVRGLIVFSPFLKCLIAHLALGYRSASQSFHLEVDYVRLAESTSQISSSGKARPMRCHAVP